MGNLYMVLAVLLGAALGMVIGWLWRGSRTDNHGTEDAGKMALLEERASRAESLESQLAETSTAREQAERQALQFEVELKALQTQFEDHKTAVKEREETRKADVEQKKSDQELMVAKFKAAAHEIVEERSKAFDTTSKKSIGELIKPLKEKLEGFQNQLKESEKSASKERISLEEQIKNLTAINSKMSDEAQNLTRALKGDAKARGNWGEMVLGRVLELSGLQEGREYETEVTETDDEGKRKRPDVIVQLPGERQVIVDSKVSLVDYDAYCDAETSEEQTAAMKRHVSSIRGHVKGLSDKNYHHLEGITTIDYVLMFMPIEAAFTEAMRFDRGLYEEAISKRVLIVTPSTLLAVLRTIETIWRHERQTKNAVEIARQAGQLHDKFMGFAASLEDVGKRLDGAKTSYDKAFNQLKTGTGNLVKRVKNLEALGAKTSKELPASLRDADDL